MKIYRGAKKALIALLTFASLICLGTVAVSAEEITAERVEELIWADTLDKNPALQSILVRSVCAITDRRSFTQDYMLTRNTR